MKTFKKVMALFVVAIISLNFMGCSDIKKDSTQKNYEGRTFYEIFVRSFKDSNGDGIGDLNGVTEKLDYLEDLGVKGIWLMPIFKAKSYHGYDTVDYYQIQDEYGTMDDLENLLEEAHKRDIKVIVDLVINHTSTECEWFKQARNDENSPYRDYYIWNKDMSKKNEISQMNTKKWTQNGEKQELYYSIFDSGMPDLNMENSKVVDEVDNIAKFYLDKGVDGFRIDAAKWIFESKSDNVTFWKKFNDYVKSINENTILVAEIWDSSFNIIEYAGSLDSFFEFSIGKYTKDRINSCNISGFPEDYLAVTEGYKKENQNFVVAPFLTNHDNVRIMTTLGDDFKMKEAACMYLTLPGTPFIYYGEETGTLGTKPDEKLREPFVWSANDPSQNASWEKISNDVNQVAVDTQKDDKKSLLNFYKDIIKVKNNYKSLRFGEVSMLKGEYNSNVMVMQRSYEDEISYVIINGNAASCDIPLPKGKYNVLYSSERDYSSDGKNIKVKSDGNFNVNGEEIMILGQKK